VTSKPDFKVMVLLLVFMQLTRDLFAIAKFLFSILLRDAIAKRGIAVAVFSFCMSVTHLLC